MGQGHAGARDPLCRAGFHPRSHCRGDPSRRPAGTFGAADKPRLGKSGLHDAERLRDLARLEGLELRALVAASSGRGTSLRGCFSIARRKRVGAGLEASVAHGAADRDHLLRRPSRHAGSAEARAFGQVSLGAAHSTGLRLRGPPSTIVATVASRSREVQSRDARSGQAEICAAPEAGRLTGEEDGPRGPSRRIAPGRAALTAKSNSRLVRHYLPRVIFYATVVVALLRDRRLDIELPPVKPLVELPNPVGVGSSTESLPHRACSTVAHRKSPLSIPRETNNAEE